MKLYASLAALALSLVGCNWTSQLDRDAGACVILSKQGGECTVTIPAAKPQEPTP